MKKYRVSLIGVFLVLAVVLEASEIGTAYSNYFNGSGSENYSSEGKASVIPTADEIQLIELVNSARQDPSSVGWGSYPAVGVLHVNINLWEAGRFHSQEMITNNYFAHDSYNSSGVMYETCEDRIIETFSYTPEGKIGENIAGNPTVAGAFQAWLNSTGHRNNIFDGSYTEHGIGIINGGPYGKMFTHDFGYRTIQYDLSVSSTDISFTPTNPLPGQSVQITVSVHELQKTHAFPVIVQVYDGNPSSGGQLIKEDTVDAIIGYNSYENIVVPWNTTGEPTGGHEIWVKVDPGNKFSETNESNNTASKSITIGVEEAMVSSLALNLTAMPGNRGIEFTYSLGFSGRCVLSIYDISGNLAGTVVDAEKTPGCYKAGWESKVPAGIYFCNLKCNEVGITKKVVIVK